MAFCFLDSRDFADGSIRGAALVTDARTRPLEFRVTDAVHTTALQRVLYGAVLDEHVVGELIGRPLLEALRETIECVLVCDQRLLALQQSDGPPVVWIGRDEAPRDGERGAIVMGYRGDDDTDPRVRAARESLRAASAGYDLLEPFARIATALDRVHAQSVAASAG